MHHPMADCMDGRLVEDGGPEALQNGLQRFLVRGKVQDLLPLVPIEGAGQNGVVQADPFGHALGDGDFFPHIEQVELQARRASIQNENEHGIPHDRNSLTTPVRDRCLIVDELVIMSV